ncbi:hypothetical protein BI364_02415 [Acidihalobacter yilgarnensis]|uniref:Diguanylate cyclase n=1 Tax=Acidihalobacter yilgarnensis TaxID=2819280 RepID=A0A1D8IKL1_9GAMM|nr:GGDEF domain-containing protein [Acidihalobacter yilgarnensis]AOU97009.1 hypothetical protein BI364_02415 [Acidihalobacter yilgarnensis]
MLDEQPKLADITAHLRDVVFRTHRNGYWCYLSPAWEQLTGYSVEESIGRHLIDTVHPDDRDMNLKVKQSLEVGQCNSSRHTKRMLCKDGRIIHVEVDVSITHGDEHEGRVSVGTIRDITERVEMEARISAERQRHEAVLSALQEGVVSLDLAGHIRYLNPTARDITGWIVGARIDEALSATLKIEDPHWITHLLNQLGTGLPYRHERPLKLISAPRWVELRLVPLDQTPAPNGGVLVLRDISAEQSLLERLRYQAEHDALTDLINRHAMHDILGREHANALRTGRPYALLICDLDEFKRVNDLHGHATGDHVLQTVALRLRQLMRRGDWLARWGGEEFLCLLPETEPEEAFSIAGRLCHDIATHAWEDPLDAMSPTMSIGMACWPDDLSDPEKLMLSADDALYRAKRSGRNRVWRIHPGDNVHEL